MTPIICNTANNEKLGEYWLNSYIILQIEYYIWIKKICLNLKVTNEKFLIATSLERTPGYFYDFYKNFRKVVLKFKDSCNNVMNCCSCVFARFMSQNSDIA